MKTSKRSRRSQRGSTFATLLVVVAVTELMLSVPAIGALARIPGVPILLVVMALALVVGLVIDLDRTNLVITALGVVVLAATLGLAGTIEAVLIVTFLSWFVAVLRKGWR